MAAQKQRRIPRALERRSILKKYKTGKRSIEDADDESTELEQCGAHS